MSSPASLVRPGTRLLAVGLVALLAVVLLPPVARAATVEVRIGAALSPATVEVAPGTTVTWVNDHDERHRVRSTDGPEEFDSGNLEPGERFSHTFTAEGTTRYVDDRDRDVTAYHGTIVVRAADSSPSPSPTAAPGEPTGPTTHTVGMRDRRFTPARLEITTGDTVRFRNDDDRDHTATADDGSFDSGILAAGRAFDRTFSRAGTFSYLCLLHPDMVGTIAVADPGGTAPPPAPAPAPAPAPSQPAPAPTTSAPSTGGGTPVAPQRVIVEMRDFAFAPARVEVPVGSTVVFSNTGRALHTATADDGSFDSDLVSPGGTFERRFDRAGTVAYTCLLHPEMVGTVVVTAAGGGSTTPVAAPGSTVPDGTEAGGGSTPVTTSAPRAAPGTVVVSLDDFVFSPSNVRLTVGDTVRFRNDGAALHTATARDGSYDSGLLRPGGVAEHTFRRAGTFAWWCTLHPEMVATIRVADAAGDVPDAEVLSDSLSATEGTDVGAGPGASGGGTGQDGAGTAVSMVDNTFLPEVLEVTIGAEVVWTNDGAAVHTVTADDGAFDSGLVAPGATFASSFDEVGTVTYSCIVHPGMVGEVRVLELSDAGAAVGPTATGETGAELSTVRLQLLMLGAFAVALAGFTALARRIGERDVEVR